MIIIRVAAFIAHEVVAKWKEAYDSFDAAVHPGDESVAGFGTAIYTKEVAGANIDLPPSIEPVILVPNDTVPGMLLPGYKGPMIGFMRSQDDILITAENE